ncbi:MAG: hypothetical protein M1839_007702 [Geoglossum umbratile]|nr:MAG: hypothetical protein M1839_007702 [Geoglossum umbratile]
MEGKGNGLATDPPCFALRLSETAQKNAREDPKVIPALLNRAVEGVGDGIDVESLIPSELSETLAALVARAVCIDPDYDPPDFGVWYRVSLTTDAAANPILGGQTGPGIADRLVECLNGPNFPEVESAHTLHLTPPPANVGGSQGLVPPNGGSQGYLGRAPGGIGVRAVRHYSGDDGGYGYGIDFVDMEDDWDLLHTGLPGDITRIEVENTDFDLKAADPMEAKKHGTSVLGVVLMTEEAKGEGIAPKGKGYVIREWKGSNSAPCKAESIIRTVARMKPGSVLLLESQEKHPYINNRGWPIEIVDVNFEAIRLATALGIVVVEAAGNFGEGDDMFGMDVDPIGARLDSYTTPRGISIFNRGSRDSGAIMVSGSASMLPLEPNRPLKPNIPSLSWRRFNYGSRVDMFAWGENVLTTTAGSGRHDLYTTDEREGFNGTSSASAIIAGAAMILQGFARNKVPVLPGRDPYCFSPAEVRYLLAVEGTLSEGGPGDEIGVMPNLEKVASSVWLNLTPDLYLRSFIGDTGRRPLPLMEFTDSPDIIILSAQLTDPQATLGDGSSPPLPEQLQPRKPYWVYVRLWNGGGAAAENVSVDLYWYRPETPITGNLLKNRFGTATVGRVQPGGGFMVSKGIPWSWTDQLGNSNSVSFAAVAGSADGGKPHVPDFARTPALGNPANHHPINSTDPDVNGQLEKLMRFVKDNKNVALRNVTRILNPPERMQFHSFPFYVPGTGDFDRKFRMESHGSLPPGSMVQLCLPLSLARQLRVKMLCFRGNTDQVELPLPPNARYRIGEGVIPADCLAQCELRVSVPEDAYTAPGRYEFTIRHLCNDDEVGRLAWRFGHFRPEKHYKTPASTELI